MAPALVEYVGFLAKTITVLVACVILISIRLAAARNKGKSKEGKIKVTSLNKFYTKMHDAISDQLMNKAEKKAQKAALKALKKSEEVSKVDAAKVFVLDFNGDMNASGVESLRHEVTALLGHAKPQDEVVLRLESPGGVVHGYGLAASQLVRIREANIPLTICVDKMAASGGYMMACLGNKILSAPFAILGSIGVVAQLPNVHRLLKKLDIDVELITAGEHKRTLTVIGENTDEGRAKFKEEITVIHELFKGFVSKYRPYLDIEKVATGESWFGTSAIEKGLADSLITSDEYLANAAKTRDLYHVTYELPKKGGLKARLGIAAATVVENALTNLWTRVLKVRGY